MTKKTPSISSKGSEQFDIEEMIVDEDKTSQAADRSQDDERRSSYDIGLEESEDLIVLGDEKKLRGILICLLSNVSALSLTF